MILLNFAHPLTQQQLEQVAQAAGVTSPLDVLPIAAQFDPQQPFAPQAAALADAAGLSSAQWQTVPLLVNLPSLNHIAACLLAELHGRMGYFPSIIRLRPLAGSTPPRFEFAEVINLQQLRDKSREQR